MRERMMTLVCALGALLVFGTLFIRGGGPGAREVALPTSAEHRGDGLLGTMLWLRGEGVRTVSFRDRFGTLVKRHDLAPAGNLLIVALPAVTAFRTDEAVALDAWIRAGNTLLVTAALSDRPRWAVGGAVLEGDVRLLTGLELDVAHPRDQGKARAPPRRPAAPVPPGKTAKPAPAREPESDDNAQISIERVIEASRKLDKPARGTLVPNRPHPYLAGVNSAVGLSDYPSLAWSVTAPREGFVLSLAHHGETGEGVLWIRPDGSGTIIVSGFGSLFSNRALGLADNARLLANIVAATVGPHGAVMFDDEHQGLSAAYDPAKFYKDPRLYATLGVIALVWLVWVLGGTQLQMPSARAAAPREAELVRASGAFLARVLRPPAAARRMFDHFFQRVRAPLRGRTPDHVPLWDWLENHPRLARADVTQLKAWYADAYSDRRVPLLRLHNLIVRTERQLAA